MTVNKRSVISVVIFSLITCGIYTIYWLYVTTKELQAASGRSQFSPGLILVLAIFVAPVAAALFAVEANDDLNAIRAMKGMPPADNTVLWVIVGILIDIVAVALIQNEINTVA